jgi:hypothetical protein
MWQWIDENQHMDYVESNEEWRVADQHPWWEDMAESTVENCGRINVA